MEDRAPLESRVAEIAALDQPVRRDLYSFLVDRDEWVGRDEAAEALGIPRSVAAFHLDKLAEVGLVEVRFVRPDRPHRPRRGEAGQAVPTRRRAR